MFGEDSLFTSGETGAIKNSSQLVPHTLPTPSAISPADKSLFSKYWTVAVQLPSSTEFLVKLFYMLS